MNHQEAGFSFVTSYAGGISFPEQRISLGIRQIQEFPIFPL